MLLIAHRVNRVTDLLKVPSGMGVEVDLRDFGKRLVMHHDPHRDGEDFETFLKHYRHRLIILNVKSEGIEMEILRLMKKYRVKDYFFLDVSFPALMKLHRHGETRVAVRYSEQEPMESCLALKGMVDWVWIDCFTRLPLTPVIYQALKKHFKLCLVSPELQKHGLLSIDAYRKKLIRMPLDAVCTDRPDLWV